MEIETFVEGASATVAPRGSLNFLTSRELAQVVSEVADDVDELVFDFRDVDFVSTAGLRVVHLAFKQLGGRGGTVRIANANELVRETLEDTAMQELLG